MEAISKFTPLAQFFSTEDTYEDSNMFQVSDVVFHDELHNETNFDGDDAYILSLMPLDLKPGGFYAKKELHDVLQSLVNSRMFEKVDLEYRTNLDHTLTVTIFYTEKMLPPVNYFRCVNMGVRSHVTEVRMIVDNVKHLMEYVLGQTKGVDEIKCEEPRACLIPLSIYLDVLWMLGEEGKEGVSGRLLFNIREVIQQWYHNEGYVAAKVINFIILDTSEVIGEVMEGYITKLVLIEGNTTTAELPVELVDLCEEVDVAVGNVFNEKASQQVEANLKCLGLYSQVDVCWRTDDKNERGVVVEIKVVSKSTSTASNLSQSLSIIDTIKSNFSALFF